MNTTKSDVVMLYSGGADSLLMLKLALMAGKSPHCILINYGQKHVDELNFAEDQLSDMNIPYQVITIQDLNVDSGLTGDLTEARWDNVHEMNVPGRNTIFIGLAISVAENMDIDEVWYGPDYSDRINLFPDCYQEYVVKMNELLALQGSKQIKLVAPLLGMSKELILEILENHFAIGPNQMHSGYEPPQSKPMCEEARCQCPECRPCDEIDHQCKMGSSARSGMRYA